MRSRAAPGFSLLELLVAITLLGFLSALIAGGVRFGLRAWERGARDAAAIEVGRQVESLMRRQLAGLAPRTLRGPGREVVVAFWGDTQSLRFVGRMPAIAQAQGDVVITYGLEDNRSGGNRGAGQDLVLRWQPLDATQDPALDGVQISRERLLSGVKRVRFAYYGDRGWQERWWARPRPPTLIKVEAEPVNPDAWVLPPLIIRVETGAHDP